MWMCLTFKACDHYSGTWFICPQAGRNAALHNCTAAEQPYTSPGTSKATPIWKEVLPPKGHYAWHCVAPGGLKS